MKKKTLTRTLEIPEGVTIEISDKQVKVRGEKGELERKLFNPLVSMKVENNEMKFECGNQRNAKRMMNSFVAHVKNMIFGVQEGYLYTLKICSGHFPMTVNQEGDTVMIKNFLGEKIPRRAKIVGDTEVKIQQDKIEISGTDKEATGQTAANIEQSTKIPNKDRRRFQDGIFITSKGGSKK